ncbi:DEAD/DEAH box helicase family protein [Streptomyces sp. NPDC017448]|uniref:DEAD/DEAH box helicase n=1 Tax=Streptomyces sp. NPDC017448 TaxID=3364996 RepID=UPI003797AB0A
MKARPHQLDALAAVRQVETDRALVLMACGTGKTLVGREAAIERAGSTGAIMVLVPSKELVRQTFVDWRREVAGGVDGLLVFSDSAVDDSIATTDAQDIADFLSGKSDRLKLIVGTYHSAQRVAEAYVLRPGMKPFDVLVLDEAHRTAGKATGEFAAALDNSKIPADFRLFLTATTRVHSEEDGADDVVSMDDAGVYGPLCFELTFGAAISEALLSDFTVAVAVVDDAEVHRVLSQQSSARWAKGLTASQVATQIAVARAVEKYGLERIIAFHGRVERSESFTRSLSGAAQTVGTIPIDAVQVSGTTPQAQRRKALERLASPAAGHATVLSNVAVLTEGVDVPAVDSVVFADPKTSKIAIAQAVGRALRLHPGKGRDAVIVLPVYLAPGENAEQVVASSEFRHVYSVLTSLRDYDERLDADLSAARVSLGQQGIKEVELPARINILNSDSDLEERLFSSLKVQLLRNVTETWLERYGQLKAYIDFTGEIPRNRYVTPDGVPLGHWANTQRRAYRKGRLLSSRVEMLEQIPGWTWGESKPSYKDLDLDAIRKLISEWQVAMRLNLPSNAPVKQELALRCAELVPDFKYPMTKFKASDHQALMGMEFLHKRIKQAQR